MEQSNQSNLIGKSKQFNEKINTIKSQFFSVLDDFKKYYVYFNKNPEVSEFQNYYNNTKGQLQTLYQELFSTKQIINKSIEDLYKEISYVSKDLKEEEELNKQLTDLVVNLDNTHDGSKILIDDSKTIYNNQYYQNIELFVGIIIIGASLSLLFKKNTSVSIVK